MVLQALQKSARSYRLPNAWKIQPITAAEMINGGAKRLVRIALSLATTTNPQRAVDKGSHPVVGTRIKPVKNPASSPNQRQHGVLPELPIRIELMTFSLRVKRSTD